jgi:hypothetical protein
MSGDFTWKVSDCEELSGGHSQWGWGGYFDLNIYDFIYLLSRQTRKDFLLDLCLINKRNDVFFESILVIQDIKIIKRTF